MSPGPDDGMRSRRCFASALPGPRRTLACIATLCAATGAFAEAGFEPAQIENWGYFQRNESGSAEWKLQPRLLVPYRFANDWSFTQRVDLPLVYTDKAGTANPDGTWSFGVGNIFVEEIVESREVADGLRLKTSVRFVFPTGKATPFGSSQYQWAPGVGAVYAMPSLLRGVTLAPYVRYFSGFAPTRADVTEVRRFDLYPALDFGLGGCWSLHLYPENPIEYNRSNGAWFVPLDAMVACRLSRTLQWGLGGAYKLGDPRDPPYRYIVDTRLAVRF